MTPKQYRAAIERLGLSQEGAGVLFGVTKRTGQNWVANGPPPPVAILIRLMLAGKITETDVHNVKGKTA
jgi:hypothetical protein